MASAAFTDGGALSTFCDETTDIYDATTDAYTCTSNTPDSIVNEMQSFEEARCCGENTATTDGTSVCSSRITSNANSGATTNNDGDACTANSECTSGICIAGTCAATCTNDAQCVSGICNDGTCVMLCADRFENPGNACDTLTHYFFVRDPKNYVEDENCHLKTEKYQDYQSNGCCIGSNSNTCPCDHLKSAQC